MSSRRRGREIALQVMDDAYVPARTVKNVTELVDTQSVFALISPMGTANTAALLPLIDRLFGTYAVDPVHWPARYGIDETLDPGLAGQLLQAFGSERR